MEISVIAKLLKPYILTMIANAHLDEGSGSSVSSVPNPHHLNSSYHDGTLADAQAPQFLKIDGTRDLQGNLNVGSGYTVDGVDISAHAIDINAHHNKQHSITDAANHTVVGVQYDVVGLSATNTLAILHTNSDGKANVNTILRSSASGVITLATLTTDTITAPTSLTINPTNDILIPNAKTIRSSTFSSTFPIGGWAIAPTSIAGQSGLTIGRINADELHVKIFVADETRVDRGELWISKSYGVVETDFTTPGSLGGTVTVRFEDSPALAALPIFTNNDWVLIRVVDRTLGITVTSIWGQVSSYSALGSGVQSWTFTLRQGSTSYLIKKGAYVVDWGASGQGVIQQTVIDPTGAPYIKIFTWSGANPYTPANYSTKVKLGKLINADDASGVLFPTGWGLYAENVFLKGDIVAGNGNVQIVSTGVNIQEGAYSGPTLYTSYNAIKWWPNVTVQTGDPTLAIYSTVQTSTSMNRIMYEAYPTAGNIVNLYIIAKRYFGSTPSQILMVGGNGSTDSSLRLLADDIQITSGSGGTRGVFINSNLNTTNIQNNSSGAYDIGTFANPYGTIYVNNVVAGSITGSVALGGQTWQYNSGDMFISSISPSNRTLYIANSSSGTFSLDVEGDITLGGLVDGVDIAAHAINVNAHHNAATSSTGITVAAGQIISINQAANLAWTGNHTFSQNIGLNEYSPTANIHLKNAWSTPLAILKFSKTDNTYSHGMTSLTNATVGNEIGFLVQGGTDGGLSFVGISDNDSSALYLEGNVGSTTPSVAAVVIQGWKKNGVNHAAMASTDKILDVNAGASNIMRLTAAGVLTLNGLTVFTTANDGSGSGLDADTVDGFDSASIVLIANARTITAVHTFNPGSATAPFILGANGQGQTIVGLKADQLNKSVIAGATMSGGGVLTANRTLTVDQGYAFTWSNSHNWSSGSITLASGDFNATTGVYKIAGTTVIDATKHFLSIAGTTANASFSFALDPNTGLINPGADILGLVAGGVEVLDISTTRLTPSSTGTISIGDYNRKFGDLFVTGLYAQTLVAQSVMATIGGRIIVAPSNSLIIDINNSVTTIDVKYNNFASGDYIYFESLSSGMSIQKQYMKVTSAPTTIAGGYRYTVTRNIGTQYAWKTGDGIVNIGGTVGSGFIELTSTSTTQSHLGPTITIYSRTSTANVFDLKPVVTMGNLHSFVDYSTDTFGFAVGNDLTLTPSGGFSGVTADATNGLRMFNTGLTIYDTGVMSIDISKNDGVNLVATTSAGNNYQILSWWKDLTTRGTDTALSFIRTYRDATNVYMSIMSQGFWMSIPNSSVAITANAVAPSSIGVYGGATSASATIGITSSGSVTIQSGLSVFNSVQVTGNTYFINNQRINGDLSVVGYTLFGSTSTSDVNNNGVQVRTTISETAVGVDNIRFGVVTGTPRIIWEDATFTQWEMDNSAGVLRFLNPGAVKASLNTSGDLMVTGKVSTGGVTATEYLDNRAGNMLAHATAGYIYGGTALPFTLRAWGGIDIGIGGSGGGFAVIGAYMQAHTNKVLNGYGAGTDGTRFWSGALGFGAYWDGTNYKTGTDGGSNGGALIIGENTGNSIAFYSIASTGVAQQTITPANISNYERLRLDDANLTATVKIGNNYTGLSYASGWVDYGAGWPVGRYRKFGDVVTVSGLVKRTSGSAATIATLPVGYRPLSGTSRMFTTLIADTSERAIRIDVDSSGNITLNGPNATVSYVSIEFSFTTT